MTLEEYCRDHLDAWVASIEIYLGESGSDLPPELEKLAAGFEDYALAQWVRIHGDPGRIRQRVNAVRQRLLDGDLVGGMRAVERFETDRRFMEQLLNRPYMVTGRKFLNGPKRPRTDPLNRLIDEALSHLGRAATAAQILDHIKHDTETVQDVDPDDGTIWWRGRDKPTSYKSFQNRITARRKKIEI